MLVSIVIRPVRFGKKDVRETSRFDTEGEVLWKKGALGICPADFVSSLSLRVYILLSGRSKDSVVCRISCSEHGEVEAAQELSISTPGRKVSTPGSTVERQ